MSPKVSIIIPTLSSKTKRYLDICIESIYNLDYDRDLLDIVISSPQSYFPHYPGTRVVHHEREDREYAEAVNVGVNASDPESKHILLLSDDVILTRDSLKNMVHTAGDSEALFGATSNCDNYWKYRLAFHVEHKGERLPMSERFMRLDNVDYLVPAMMNAQSNYPSGAFKTDTLCFYATMIPRKVWEKLGPLDERFQTGFEDSDYCTRASQAGISLYVILNALIWHFGGVTSSESVRDDQRLENERLYFEKWHTNKDVNP